MRASVAAMRIFIVTVAISLCLPSVASAHELRLLDTTLAMADQRATDPLDIPYRPTPHWTAATSAYGFLAAEVAWVASLTIGAAAALIADASGNGGDYGLGALVWGALASGVSSVFLLPLSVSLVGNAYEMHTSYPLMCLGAVLGLAAGIAGSAALESVVPLLFVPAVFTVFFGALTAGPKLAPPETQEFDDDDEDAAAANPRRTGYARAERLEPRALVIPVVALRF